MMIRWMLSSLVVFFCVSACYRQPVVQGHILTSEQIHHIHLNMKRSDVVQIFGTPLLNALYADDWYYLATVHLQEKMHMCQKIKLHFHNNLLVNIDALPIHDPLCSQD